MNLNCNEQETCMLMKTKLVTLERYIITKINFFTKVFISYFLHLKL